MKPTYLLGLSVVAAAIIFSGCGSSDDAANPAAITAPDEVKQALDLNQSTIQNVMALLRYRMGGGPLAPQKASSTTSNTGTNTYDCDLGGTYTYTYDYSNVNEDDGSTTYKDAWSYDYKDCVYSSSNSYLTVPLANRYTRNGTTSGYYTSHYDAMTSSYQYTSGGEDNYTNVYDNNETDDGLSSRTYTSTLVGDYTYDSLTSINTQNKNGERSALDINATGDIVGGYKNTYDRYITESTNQPELESYKANGSYTYITYNSDGTTNLNTADYFVNFAFSAKGGDDHNISVSGKVGTLCLGGSVSFTTSPVVREDQMSYLDDTNNTGNNVLPYAGVVTVKGTSTATVTFDNNTTHSNAVVHTGSTDMTYGSWSELAVGPCN